MDLRNGKNLKVYNYELSLYYYRPNLKIKVVKPSSWFFTFLRKIPSHFLMLTFWPFFLTSLCSPNLILIPPWKPWSDLALFNWFKFKYLIIIFLIQILLPLNPWESQANQSLPQCHSREASGPGQASWERNQLTSRLTTKWSHFSKRTISPLETSPSSKASPSSSPTMRILTSTLHPVSTRTSRIRRRGIRFWRRKLMKRKSTEKPKSRRLLYQSKTFLMRQLSLRSSPHWPVLRRKMSLRNPISTQSHSHQNLQFSGGRWWRIWERHLTS